MDRDIRAGALVVAMGGIGVILAAILKVLNDEGVLVDEFITGSILLPELMAVVIILFLIVGAILGVASR